MDRDNEPTHDDVTGGSASITLLEFLDGSGLLSLRGVRSFDGSETSSRE